MPEIEITEKNIRLYTCPICHFSYDSMEDAENCMTAGQALQDFKEEDVLWRWVILENLHGCKMAYIPRKVDKKYEWTGNPACRMRKISLFNSFSHAYVSVIPGTATIYDGYDIREILDLMAGWEKYRLVPPLGWMKGMPEEIRKESEKILKLAFSFAKKELRDALNGDPDRLEELLAGFRFRDFHYEDEPFTEMPLLPETALVTGNSLLSLEKVPAFSGK